MIEIQDITEMDDDDIATFVREECETIADVTKAIDFAQELKEYGLDELEFRENGGVREQ